MGCCEDCNKTPISIKRVELDQLRNYPLLSKACAPWSWLLNNVLIYSDELQNSNCLNDQSKRKLVVSVGSQPLGVLGGTL